MRQFFDFATFIDGKAAWSRETFGPQTVAGLRKHIDKELAEIDRDPADLIEWVDLVLPALEALARRVARMEECSPRDEALVEAARAALGDG